jgi:hydroxymethylglutaryl-CoA lyase
VSASETHSRKNTGLDTADAATRILATARAALEVGATVQLSVQSAFGCGYEGPVPAARVLNLVRQFVDAGFRTISLADTAGHATPPQVAALVTDVLEVAPGVTCACHFHDTYGVALANAWAALESGAESFESAFAGLGGCPFTALPSGNLCTEDFLHVLQRTGRRPDISLAALIDLALEAEQFFGRTLPGFVHRTGPIAAAAPV